MYNPIVRARGSTKIQEQPMNKHYVREDDDTDRYPSGWSIWGLVSVVLYAIAFGVGFAIGSLLT